MDVAFLIARVVHVGLGVFWVGAIIFTAAFLFPAMRDAGPAGASVGAGLMRRGFLNIIPAAAALTLLSGLYLYWRVSGGFSSDFMRSPMGMTYGAGALAALVGFGLGVGVIRPSMLRAAALSEAAAGAQPEEREKAMAVAQSLRMRAGSAGRTVAWLLGAAAIAMALGRYM